MTEPDFALRGRKLTLDEHAPKVWRRNGLKPENAESDEVLIAVAERLRYLNELLEQRHKKIRSLEQQLDWWEERFPESIPANARGRYGDA